MARQITSDEKIESQTIVAIRSDGGELVIERPHGYPDVLLGSSSIHLYVRCCNMRSGGRTGLPSYMEQFNIPLRLKWDGFVLRPCLEDLNRMRFSELPDELVRHSSQWSNLHWIAVFFTEDGLGLEREQWDGLAEGRQLTFVLPERYSDGESVQIDVGQITRIVGVMPA